MHLVSIPFKRVSVFKATWTYVWDAGDAWIVSIPFKRVSVFKVGIQHVLLFLHGSTVFPSPLSGSRFSKECIKIMAELAQAAWQVSIPFKRVSVFKGGSFKDRLPAMGGKFPSPLSGSRFSKEEAR